MENASQAYPPPKIVAAWKLALALSETKRYRDACHKEILTLGLNNKDDEPMTEKDWDRLLNQTIAENQFKITFASLVL